MTIPSKTGFPEEPDALNRRLAFFLLEQCASANAGKKLTLDLGNVELRVIPGDSVELPLITPSVDAVVIFAGSNDLLDWIHNAGVAKRECPENGGGVHAGFDRDFSAVKDLILDGLAGMRSVGIAGHSRGHPLACMLAEELDNRGIDVAFVVTFGGPRWCDASRRDHYNARGIPTHRFVVGWDAVPRWPKLGYKHVGKMICLTPDGKVSRSQKHPSLWTPWRFLFSACSDHIASQDYTRAVRAWMGA